MVLKGPQKVFCFSKVTIDLIPEVSLTLLPKELFPNLFESLR